MPRATPQTASHIEPVAPADARAALVRHLLKVDAATPVLTLEALGDATTRMRPLGHGQDSDEIFEGHVLAAMEHLARSSAAEPYPNVFIELFDGLSTKERARQAKTWDARHHASQWPFPNTERHWGPLLAAMAALEMGATRAVIHLPTTCLTSSDGAPARRTLLDRHLVASVAFPQLPLSAPAAERDCYLVISQANETISFCEVPKVSPSSRNQPAEEIALVSPKDLLLSPHAGLSLFDAKVAQEKHDGRETLGDIATVLSSAGSAIRRNGGLSDDDTLPMRYISIVDFDHGTLKPKGRYFKADGSFDIKKYQLMAGDILIARNATAGGIQIVTYDPADQVKPLVASENVLVLRLKEHAFHPYALYLYLAFGVGGVYLTDCRAGAALGSISPKRLLDIPAPVVTADDDRRIRQLYWQYLGMVEEYEEMLNRFSEHEGDARAAALALDLHANRSPAWRTSTMRREQPRSD